MLSLRLQLPPDAIDNGTPFSGQFWTICMEFGKSATNFDIPAAESCPNGRRTTVPPKLPALFPKCMNCHLNWPEKGVVSLPFRLLSRSSPVSLSRPRPSSTPGLCPLSSAKLSLLPLRLLSAPCDAASCRPVPSFRAVVPSRVVSSFRSLSCRNPGVSAAVINGRLWGRLSAARLSPVQAG